MEKFVEFETFESNDEMELYVRLESGNLVHVRDYGCFCDDYGFRVDEQGMLTEIYSHSGVTCLIRDGKLFELTFDYNGCGTETELSLELLLANAEADELYNTY